MKLNLEAKLIGEALILNGSLDPTYGDYIELNDLNEPLELRRNQVEDLGPTIEDGEVIDEPMEDIVETRNDDGIDEYPSFCYVDRKIRIDCAYNLEGVNGNGGGNGNVNGNGNENGMGGGNGDGNPNMNVGGLMPVARECTYQDFLICQPLIFEGTEGFVGLTRWIEKMEIVFHISSYPPKYQVKYATCTLYNSALTWWNSHKRKIKTDAAYAMTWKEIMKLMQGMRFRK
nr:hypothetical protein [Tanacetum cinerariifolium]